MAEEGGEFEEWIAVSDPVELSGQRFQHFEVERIADGNLRELGRGAMGITYKAFDTNLHCPVALKIINSQLTDDPKARERFLREARAAARLRHPNVATVLHLGWDGDACFYAMEFIQGETLEAFVARAGPLPLAQALEIAAQAARALGAAQSEGLVHRDIKPANIMLARHKGEEDEDTLHVKVIDFGLAKFAAEGLQERFVWDFPYFAGTPHFASPEQWAGEVVDGRSDIYSLGVTLWHMLTGAAPPRNGAATLAKETSQQAPLPLPPLADQPKCVQALLDSMSAPEKALRPQNAAELLAAIAQCQTKISPPRCLGVRDWSALLLLLFFLTVGGVAMGFGWRTERRVTPHVAIEILPFIGARSKQDREFGERISESLEADLSKNPAIKVVFFPPHPSKNYESGPTNHAGGTPSVKWQLKGKMERDHGVLRFSVNLCDASSQSSLWGGFFDYDGQSADLASIQADLVRNILKSLRQNYLPENPFLMVAETTESPQAADSFRLGQEQARKFTSEGLAQGLIYYRRALALSPRSARVHAAIAEVCCQQVSLFGSPPSQLDSAKSSANEAVKLAPDDPSGYVALSAIYSIMGDQRKAMEQCRQAIAVAPGYSAAIRTFGVLWLMAGKPEKGLPWLHAATRLAPDNVSNWYALGDAYKDLDDFDAAKTYFARVLAFDSVRVDARLALAHISLSEGKIDQARQECAGALLVQPESVLCLSLAGLIEFYDGDYAKAESIYRRLLRMRRSGNVTYYGGVRYLAALGHIRYQLGDAVEGEALLREAIALDEKSAAVEFQSVFDLAAIRASERRVEEALTLLQRAVDLGWVDYRAIQLDPRFRTLTGNPRFTMLVNELRIKIERLRAETLTAVAKPLRLVDFPVPPPEPQTANRAGN